MGIFQIALILATFLCSLVAGFLFAFALVAMPGIRNLNGSSGFLVGGQRVAGSSILPTRRRPQSHRSPKGGQEIPKYPTRQSGRGQLVKGIRH